jgi:hypothetical protein
MFSNLAQLRLLNKIETSQDYTMEEVASNDSRQQTIALIMLSIITVVTVLFLLWKYRCYRNLEVLNGYPPEHAPGWAVISYFIPIICFFRPYKIMREIWDQSDPQIENKYNSNTGKYHYLPVVWWIFVICTIIILRFKDYADVANPTIAELRYSSQFAIFYNIWIIMGATLTAYMVNKITKREEQKLINLLDHKRNNEERTGYQRSQKANIEEDTIDDEFNTDEEINPNQFSEDEKCKYYGNILGLKGAIKKSDITKTYKNLILLYHPDRVAHMAPEFQLYAEKKTKEINIAYEYFKNRYNL